MIQQCHLAYDVIIVFCALLHTTIVLINTKHVHTQTLNNNWIPTKRLLAPPGLTWPMLCTPTPVSNKTKPIVSAGQTQKSGIHCLYIFSKTNSNTDQNGKCSNCAAVESAKSDQRTKRNTLANYPWDLSFYDGDSLSSSIYSAYRDRLNSYNNGNHGSGNSGNSGNNGGNNGANHPLAMSPSMSPFSQFVQNSPYQTNRVGMDFNPMYGHMGNAPVFVVSKSMGLTSWIIPFLMLLSLPFLVGAAFIPLFLKSIVYLLQIGRNLGILFPLIPPVINGTANG